ncbi:hypothetical protein [Aeromonas molluscorum]|uniref:hypothetical protein n=1 Tax=Aeromonas molluscorum TaxID=271417 RepID=UPI003F1C7006
MDKVPMILLLCLPLAGCSSPFERLWAGVAECQLDSLYLDASTLKPGNAELAHFTPYKVANGFAWYRTRETLGEVPISGFLIPTSTFEVHALFIDAPIANARHLMVTRYGNDFSDEARHNAGEAPLLLRDPNNPKQSILDCTRDESGETTPDEPQAQ